MFRQKKEELRQALGSQDPYRIASVLEIPPLANAGFGGSSGGQSIKESLSIQGIEWGPVLSSWLEASQAASNNDAAKYYEAQSSLHAAFNHLFGSSQGNWLVPALHAICRNTHKAAVVADKCNPSGRNDNSKLENAVTLLQDSFSKTLNDRKEFVPSAPWNEDGSKKAGVLYIVNQLFSMYFRLNTLRLCKNLLRPVESHNLHEKGNMGDMVTYRYYAGRLNMFEDQYEAAESNLDYALKHCHRAAIKNKKGILRYLVPVKLLRGRLPTAQLLQKYSLHEFIPLVDGIRKGDLRTFNEGLLKYQDLFIRRGTYLLLEKCKTVCYRNLFKRVFAISGKTQIPLDNVARSFKWLGMHIDLDEVECILANLIFRGYVRGYISHAKRVLVLSKRDPFPKSAVIK
mmetsp:Transcript_9811/g.15079  ORF Transcript_9811/g.15079 Transcript_9811/m.15079 type:complete len:400 (-) Transcript_9811:12-1211(-)